MIRDWIVDIRIIVLSIEYDGDMLETDIEEC